jgi:hypothetical protein
VYVFFLIVSAILAFVNQRVLEGSSVERCDHQVSLLSALNSVCRPLQIKNGTQLWEAAAAATTTVTSTIIQFINIQA